MHSTCCMPGIVLRALQNTDLILTVTLKGRYCRYYCFTDIETESHRG